jgi:hypothetical protein
MTRPTGFGGRDMPDFGVSQTASNRGIVKDLSELAVRLGSPNFFDRQGIQVWNDDFENGYGNWVTQVHGAASFINLCADYIAQGDYALEMHNDDTSGNDATIQAHLPFPYVSTVGFEYHLKHLHAGDRFYARIDLYDGTYEYYLDAILLADDKEYWIYNDGGGYEHIDISPLNTGGTGPFNVFKIVADIANLRWRRLIVNTTEYDLSDITIRRTALGFSPAMFIFIGPISTGDDYDWVILDNMLVTLDEPI